MNGSAGSESEQLDDNPKKRAIDAHAKEPIKIDLTKRTGTTAERKDRKAFRKEVDVRRELIVNSKEVGCSCYRSHCS
jgi:hypothetical protein